MTNPSRSSILIVDDESTNLRALNTILSPDYTIFMAKSGQQALAMIEASAPDLLLLDVLMPGIDGFEVLTRLKSNPATERLPVIFITGLDGEQDEEKGFLLGAADYIKKPFKAAIVKARVNTQVQLLHRVALTEDDLIRVSSVAENSPHPMLFFNGDGQIEYMNPAVGMVTGYTKDEVLTLGLETVVGKENYQRVIESYLSHSVDVKHSFDLSILTKNGEVRDLHFSMFKAVLHSGMIGTGLTASDVTERNHLLKEMAEAKERAEYYSQLKSDFLSRMSHEMRTPMNAVLNMASLAKSAADEPRRTTCLENIEESADQMLQIVNDILDMTKIDAGSFALFAKAFDLSEFLRSLCDCARRRAAAKGLTFEAKFDSALPDMLIADEGRLRQALDNLLSNAFKFTPKGGEVRFHVRKLSEHGDNCELQFQIQDNGVGISAEKRCHLWDAFEQADNSTTRAYGGIGLGLPITRKIVELMGGNIQLDSELGKGTTFSVLIRFEFSYKQLRNETDMSPTAMSGKRILIVDDIEMNREILMALLEDCGAILEQAADGLEAVQMFSRVSYDVVLMDLHMPGMNGFNAVRQMRQSAVPQASSCRIIAVTADTGGDMIQKCLECGMNDHLAKPVNYDSLIAIIELHLRHKDVLL